MKRLKWIISASILCVMIAATSDAFAARRFSKNEIIDVPPGPDRTFLFDSGGRAPLTSLRFIAGGSPAVKIRRIVGTTNEQPISFDPPLSPFQVTVHFVQNPISSDSTIFSITVDNPTGRTQKLELGAIWQ